MAVDDHAIESLRTWFDLAFEELMKEWKSGQYTKLSFCPSHEEANAYRDAMNVLIKACYLPEYYKKYSLPPLSRQIKEQIEIEEFWANQT